MDYNGNDFRSFDPMYNTEKKKGSKGIGRKIAKGALAIMLVAAISVSSIMGYVYFTGGPQNSQLQQNSTQQGGTVYLPTYAKDALTTPQIFQMVAPSVVSITTIVKGPYGQGGKGTGTGIIMSDDGYIMTNEHVINGASTVKVTLNTGEVVTAEIVGSDENTDIGVIKIDKTGLQAATFGDSSAIVTGEPAIVIGNPLGIQFAETLTQGIISAPSRQVTIGNYVMNLIQVDAAINPGNSGGPLINSVGEVIGVVNAKIMENSNEQVEGIGFAIPIETAKSIADDLIAHGFVTDRPMMGISVSTLSPEEAAMYGMEAGAVVAEVVPGGAAELGGVKVGDKIVAFNDVEVSSFTALNFEKDKCKPGEDVTLTVVRDGKQLDLTITLQSSTD